MRVFFRFFVGDRHLQSDGRLRVNELWLAILLSLFFLPSILYSQWIQDPSIDQLMQKGIANVYNLEYSSADKFFSEVVKRKPDHPAGYFFKAMVVWLQILNNFEDESHDDKFYDMLDGVIDMCDERLDMYPNDVTALFFKGGAIGFRGRLRANRGKWLGAAKDGIQALPIVRKAYELEPNNYDVLLGIGIYNYYAEVVPQFYPYLKPFMIFFPKGNRKKGIEQLGIASEKAKYAKIESAYFLMQNYHMFEKDYDKSLEIAQRLHKEFPANPIFHRYVGRGFIGTGLWQQAYEIFLEVEKNFISRKTGYDAYDGREAFYYIGKYNFIIGRNDEAIKYFYKTDSLSRRIDKNGVSGYRSMSNLHIGMIYDMYGQRLKAVERYQAVLRMDEYEDTHTDARRYLKTPFKR